MKQLIQKIVDVVLFAVDIVMEFPGFVLAVAQGKNSDPLSVTDIRKKWMLWELSKNEKPISLRVIGRELGVSRPRSNIGRSETRRICRELGFTCKLVRSPKMALLAPCLA